ncbi:SpoIIE family protein phosphatase [Desulfuromonas carbonis]|uniref:PP2C family protein-serine/threonine phosphatase n=1 Tax=Desulfuromonas sp. DDH964 TaxID=1823759 RepID=UPI00078D0290|nr:fused response regulator/phosphatase [Desulfuromonas sp. DDH964]AMV71021.1 hypothetical protein DBW_0630 [Desulfuromonas sp. DDH964]
MTGRILLLQNDQIGGIDVAAILRGQGYAVVVSADPVQAHELLQRSPDLLLFEVGLLSAPGWEELLAHGRRLAIPSLLFSCRGQMHDLTLHSAKCDGVLLQADSVTELRARIAPLAGYRQQRLQLAGARKLLRERNREQEEELRSAAQIQRNLIPTRLPDMGNYRFAWSFEPFEKIGGDLFNVMQLDENTVMAYLFDVSGHGVSAAMVSVSVYQSLSLHTGRIVKRVFITPPYYKLLSPAEVLEELEREYPFERFEKFFTISYLLMDIPTGRIRYSGAGHPPPALVRRGGGVELLRTGGGLIGLGVGGPFAEGEVALQGGDRLFLYSDGVIEWPNQEGELFGEERFFQLLDDLRGESLAEVCRRVYAAVREFAGGGVQQDDLTLLGIEFLES